MKLYSGPLSMFGAKAEIALREKGLDFELVMVPFDMTALYSPTHPEVLRINPKGQVPLLELADGTRLSEGPVILQFIGDRAGASALLPPPGTLARYRLQEWLNYITSELHKSFTPLFHAALDAPAKATLAAGLLKKLQWLDDAMGDRPYLTGSDFTVADAYLFVVLGWAKFVQLDLGGLSRLQAFQARVGQRPAVREALRAEGLLA